MNWAVMPAVLILDVRGDHESLSVALLLRFYVLILVVGSDPGRV